jgi:hypothetical protein
VAELLQARDQVGTDERDRPTDAIRFMPSAPERAGSSSWRARRTP